MISHPFDAFYDNASEVLILGSFPSVKSREQMFYYGHPRNRFWQVIAEVYHSEVPDSIEEKKAFLTKYHVALWDVIESCEIKGSSDSSIANVKANDLNRILKNAPIQKILLNGSTAYQIYEKYILKEQRDASSFPQAYKLPSTSPANAAWSLERLCASYREVLIPS